MRREGGREHVYGRVREGGAGRDQREEKREGVNKKGESARENEGRKGKKKVYYSDTDV